MDKKTKQKEPYSQVCPAGRVCRKYKFCMEHIATTLWLRYGVDIYSGIELFQIF